MVIAVKPFKLLLVRREQVPSCVSMFRACSLIIGLVFTTATYVDDKGEASTLPVGCEYVEFELGPGTVLDVHLGMKRFCRQPSYQLPWDR